MKIIWEQIRYAFLLLRIGGPKVFLEQLKRQIYSRSVQVGFAMNLQEANIPQVEAKIKYNLRLASKEDMDEVLQKASSENKDAAQKLVFRRWLYEEGYHNCYIAKTADTAELCFMAFVIRPDDGKIVNGRFRHWFPKLKEAEVLLEGAYTFEKFRGNKLHPAINTDQLRICQEQGFKRAIVHVEKDNIASLKGTMRSGFTPFEEVPELRILFFTRRKFSLQ